MSETTTTTAATPRTIPSSVSIERSLCAEMARRASFSVSNSFIGKCVGVARRPFCEGRAGSLVAQRVYGVEPGGLPRGPEAGDEADADADHEPRGRGPERDVRGHAHGDDVSRCPPDGEAEQAARARA